MSGQILREGKNSRFDGGAQRGANLIASRVALMGHGPKDNVDAERVGFGLGHFAEVINIVPLALPAITQVGIVADDDHEALFVIKNAFIMGRFSVGTLPGNASSPEVVPMVDAWNLRLGFERENTIENRVLDGQFDGFALREDAFDLLVKIVPLAVAPEIIDHHEAAVEQVPAQSGDLFRTEKKGARFNHVDPW